MSLPEALGFYPTYTNWLKSLEGYEGQIASSSFFPARSQGQRSSYQGKFQDLLGHFAIAPYKHQAEALQLTEAGEHIVVATPTASGKSLSYQIPSLYALQQGQTTLYLFPTKALAHDQLDKLKGLAGQLGLAQHIASYDGDTPLTERHRLREEAGCLLSNPDMLHYAILPYHRNWARFLSKLAYLVIDEMHVYRGVLGSHVANVLRRLLRLAWHYGAKPQIIAASATIANASEHAFNLMGLRPSVVSEDAGPKAAKEFVFWQPPLVEKAEGQRRSANSEAAWLAGHCVKAGLKSIFFCNSRKAAELLKRYSFNYLKGDDAKCLQSYRAGYNSEDRKRLEEGFKRGDISVLIATSALELGVDIGGVDAVVLVGYPGSMTSLWQRAGRAGRSGTRALTLLIAADDPLDAYYLNHPDLITESKAEKAVADAFNTEIHPLHVACAAAEKPVAESENYAAKWLEPDSGSKLVKRQDSWVYLGRYPHKQVSIRGTGGKRILLKDGFGKTMGVSDLATALRELHTGAVYLSQGDSYLVAKLDLEAGIATLLPHMEDYYTQTRSITEIEILASDFSLYGVTVGRVRVATEYQSFVKKRYFRETILEERTLDLPQLAYSTQALWFDVSDVSFSLAPQDVASAMHALEHSLIGLLPAFVLCERADIGGVSYPVYPFTGQPLIFIYDGYPGGVGYCRTGSSVFLDWLKATHELLSTCPCKLGCPRCILSPKCGNGNQYLDKHAARVLAFELLNYLEKIYPKRSPT